MRFFTWKCQKIISANFLESRIDRRRCLLESISEAQVFVTCTDANHVVADIRLADESKQAITQKETQVEPGHTTQTRHFSFFEVRSGQVNRVEHDSRISDIL